LSVFDLHVHTTRGSSDSSLTPDQLVQEAARIGLDGICLTEHSGGWEPTELQRTFADSGLTVIQGLEVATDMGHVLVLGLHNYEAGFNRVRELRRAADRAGAVMISAHPFRNMFSRPPYNLNLLFPEMSEVPRTAREASRHPLFSVVDEIEVFNGANSPEENAFANEVGRSLGVRGTGGSDAHSSHGLGRCVTVFDGEVRSESELVEALKSKAYLPGQEYNTGGLQTP
jgi:predicted metal-dependent phosphoesterase TrpH